MRFQNKVAQSRHILLPTAIYGLIVWYVSIARWADLQSPLSAITLTHWSTTGFYPVVMAICTYLMVELNNANALIRTSTRMVSCSFVVLTTMHTFLFASMRPFLLMLCFITFLTLLFRAYQDTEAPGLSFYAFLCVGIASVLFPQVFFFVPFLWLFMVFWLMCFSWRMFFASLLGLATPYWFIIPWCFLSGHDSWPMEHFASLIQFQPIPDVVAGLRSLFTSVRGLQLVFLMFLGLLSSIHFFQNSYEDKIRTRMLFYIFISMDILLSLFIMLQPVHYEALIGCLIVCTSPLIAHFITLTHTRVTNALFILLLLITVLLTACSFMESTPLRLLHIPASVL